MTKLYIFDYSDTLVALSGEAVIDIKRLVELRKSAQLAIFSAASRATIDQYLETCPPNLFAITVSAEDVVETKPSSEGVEKILEHCHIDRQKVLYIGDSPSDLAAATTAGVRFMYIDQFLKQLVV